MDKKNGVVNKDINGNIGFELSRIIEDQNLINKIKIIGCF